MALLASRVPPIELSVLSVVNHSNSSRGNTYYFPQPAIDHLSPIFVDGFPLKGNVSILHV